MRLWNGEVTSVTYTQNRPDEMKSKNINLFYAVRDLHSHTDTLHIGVCVVECGGKGDGLKIAERTQCGRLCTGKNSVRDQTDFLSLSFVL